LHINGKHPGVLIKHLFIVYQHRVQAKPLPNQRLAAHDFHFVLFIGYHGPQLTLST
jgi:hypothetical protein